MKRRVNVDFKKRGLDAGFGSGLRGFRGAVVVAVFVVNMTGFGVIVVAVFVVDMAGFGVIVVAVFVVNVSGFGVIVVAVFVVDVSGFVVVVSATGAVNVSGFAMRRPGGNFAAQNEERERASDKQKSERADGDERGRSVRLIVVVFRFGHWGFLGVL